MTYFWNDRIVVRYCFPTKISDIGVPEAGEVDGGVHGLAHSLLDIHRGDKQLVLTSLNLWHFKINSYQPILPKLLCCLSKKYRYTQLFLPKMKKKFKVWFQKFVRITNFQDVKVSKIEFLGSEYLNSVANFDSFWVSFSFCPTLNSIFEVSNFQKLNFSDKST